MNCKIFRPRLLDFANGETGPLHSWAIHRHLRHCAECAAELAALQNFTAVLRRADIVLPEPVTFPVSPRRAQPRRALAIGFAVVAVAFGVLLMPSLTHPKSPSAAIAAALERVNTWHLSGWKLIDGKQVPWEVWGRRRPFLYYERVGDLVTWDDGKQRLRVFPPNAALNRPGGLVIKTAVTQTTADVGFQGDPAYQTLANDYTNRGHFGDGYTQIFAQTTEFARFRRQWAMGMSGVNENKLYTISKRTWLPTTYQLHFDNRKFERDSEYLKVNYDVDLPEDITTPPASAGYSVVDFTQPGEASSVAGANIVSHHSLSVQATVLALDKDGNLLIEVRGWLGKNPLTADSTFTLNLGANVSAFNSGLVGEKDGHTIKYLSIANGSLMPGSKFYLPYGPLEPPANTQALPDAFRLSLTASPELKVRGSDTFAENGDAYPSTQSESLFTDTFQWHLELSHEQLRSFTDALGSTEADDLNIYVSLLPDYLKHSVPFLLNYGMAEQRRSYYFVGDDFQEAFYTKMLPRLPKEVRQKFQKPDGSLDYGRVNDSNYYPVKGMVPQLYSVSIQYKYAAEYTAEKQRFRAHAVYWQQKKLALWPVGGGRTHNDRERLFQGRLNDTFLLAICYQEAGDTAGRNRTLRRLILECRALPQYAGMVRQAQYAIRTGQFPGDADYKGPS